MKKRKACRLVTRSSRYQSLTPSLTPRERYQALLSERRAGDLMGG